LERLRPAEGNPKVRAVRFRVSVMQFLASIPFCDICFAVKKNICGTFYDLPLAIALLLRKTFVDFLFS
jgi:hypothetical protein